MGPRPLPAVVPTRPAWMASSVSPLDPGGRGRDPGGTYRRARVRTAIAVLEPHGQPTRRGEGWFDAAVALGVGFGLLGTFVVISLLATEAAAGLTDGAALLLMGGRLVVSGRPLRGLSPEVRRSGSRGAVRWVGAGVLLLSAEFLTGGLLWWLRGQLPPEFLIGTWAIGPVAVACIGLVPQWLSWRAVTGNPPHPEGHDLLGVRGWQLTAAETGRRHADAVITDETAAFE